jgi:hypothetical protein
MTPKERYNIAEEFLTQLQRGIPEDERVMVGYAEEATLQRDENGQVKHAGWWPVPYKPGKYINVNANAYVCISSSIKTPHPKSGVMRYWRGESSFGHGMALMVDDIGDGKGSKGGLSLRWLYERLVPTAVVETSPRNYQAWYFLDAPEPDMRRFKYFLQAFVNSVLKAGGDNTIKDVSRFGRMPIGFNNKRVSSEPGAALKYPDEHTGKPWSVTLRDHDYERRYSIDRICRAFGFSFTVPPIVQRAIDEDSYIAEKVQYNMAVKILSGASMGENGGEVRENGSGKVRIICPWGHEHGNGDPSGAYFRGPIPGAEIEFVFGCAHDVHRKTNKKTWGHFVDEIVLPVVEDDLKKINEFYASRGVPPFIKP